MIIPSDRVDRLILVCDVCLERKELFIGEADGGHSWKAGNSIADDFDKLHDECEEQTDDR